MSYADRPVNDVINEPAVAGRVVDYHDRVRWGPIIGGLAVAIATQLILSALVAALTLSFSNAPRANAGNIASTIGIWSAICLLISLFTGGWFAARTCGPMNRSTAIFNGAILWATTLAVSSWLAASGVSGIFGVAASNVGAVVNQVQQSGGINIPNPNITPTNARAIAENTANGFWWFVFGSLLGLIAAVIGAAAGARKPRTNGNY